MLKLSVVMPTARDFHGCWFTIEALRLYHDLKNVEIVVLDNAPNTAEGKLLHEYIAKANRFSYGNLGCRYVPYTAVHGSAPAKEAAIQAATGDIVLCLDSHILLPPLTLAKLVTWFELRPDSKDILCGPLLDDQLRMAATQFAKVWSGEMFGVWSKTWKLPSGQNVSVSNGNGKCAFQDAVTGEPVSFIDLAFNQHESKLVEAGCEMLGTKDTDLFEIYGMGCGLFAFLKKNWVGFNPDFRGFGGEEVYLHEKFRQNGGKALCAGFLKWLHRFGRPEGVPYPLRLWDKVRNYVIGFQELGLPLDECYEHFKGKVKQHEWEALLADPIGTVEAPQRTVASVQTLFEDIQGESKYYGALMPKIKELAKGQRCVNVDRDKEACISLLAGEPKSLDVFRYHGFNPVWFEGIKGLADTQGLPFEYHQVDTHEIEIPECDVLFFKTPHVSQTIKPDLERFAPKVSRYIMLHDTGRNAIQMDPDSNGKRGIGHFPQILDFLNDNPTWFVAAHHPEAVGMTVLGRREEDKPEHPITLIMNDGPGTDLRELIWSLGVKASPTCSCFAAAKMMDGIYMYEGLEAVKAAEDQVVEIIEKNYEKLGWKGKLLSFKAGTLSLVNGVAWDLEDWSDMPRSLFRLAVRRFEAKQK